MYIYLLVIFFCEYLLVIFESVTFQYHYMLMLMLISSVLKHKLSIYLIN